MLMNDDRQLMERLESLNDKEKPFKETFNTMFINKERTLLSSFPITGRNEYNEKIELERTNDTIYLEGWRRVFNANKSIILDKTVFNTVKFLQRLTLNVDFDKYKNLAALKMTWHNYDARLSLEREVYVNEGSGHYTVTISGALFQAMLCSLKSNNITVYIRDSDQPLLFVAEWYNKGQQKVIPRWVLLAPII